MVRKKIAFFLPSCCGGPARQMINVANILADCGFDVDFLLASTKGESFDLISDKIKIIPLHCRKTILSFPFLCWYLWRKRSSVLFTAMYYVNVVVLLANILCGRKTKVIVSARNYNSIERKESKRLKERVAFGLIKYLYPFADRVVAISQGVAEDLVHSFGIDTRKIDVIYHPVINAKILMASQAIVTHPWFNEERKVPVILAVGRLVRQKDYPTLLQAFALCRQNIAAKLVILGEGSARKELQDKMGNLGISEDVDMVGHVSNPYAYLRCSDLFVLSSLYEGLASVVVEALAFAPRIVSTDCPSGPREILMDGEYGRLVPVGDVKTLADAILGSLQSPPQKVPEEVLDRFRDEKMKDQYEKLFMSLIS